MKKNNYNMFLFLVFAIACIGMGVLLEFVKSIQEKSICYLFGSIVVIVGILEIVKFFMTKAYKRVDDYSFSAGVTAVILGVICLLRVNDIIPYFVTLLMFPSLISGMILFQFSIQLNALKNQFWFVELIISVIITLGATLLLLNVSFIKDTNTWTYYLLIASGAMDLLGYLIVSVAVHKANKPGDELPPPPPEMPEDHDPHEPPKEHNPELEKIMRIDD